MTHPSDPATAEGFDDGWDDFDPWLDGSPEGSGHGWSALSGGLEDDPRVKAGLEHLQRAAREVIAASRALLDVAEEMVESPGGMSKIFGALGELGDLAQRAARAQGGSTRPDEGPDPDPPVQRIPVS